MKNLNPADGSLKIHLDMVGCRLNQSEIEMYARQFRSAGHSIVADAGEADLVVINTCSVTAAAASDSRQKARQAYRAGARQIALTGCWSTLAPQPAASLPGVVAVIPNAEKGGLVQEILGIPLEEFDLEPAAREPLPGARLRTRAFIKVQDGCDNRCTFCVTTLARGASRSRTVEAVIGDIQAAVMGGAQEAVLTGVHLGAWGHDFDPAASLKDLIAAILDRSDLPRLRLSSLEPWDLDGEFFQMWDDPRLCRHLHLPLQSGSESTLRRMARKTTPDSFRELLESARSAVPAIAVTTDIIVGFPGETETEFADSLAFVQEQAFAGGHVFTYSARQGTAAARMPDQVPFTTRKIRNQVMRESLAEDGARFQSSFIGKELPTLWETTTEMGPETWRLHGLTDNGLRVTSDARRDAWNQITPVRITGFASGGLEGIIPS
ncbi:MAG TPA: MiaB/RimO family radical SAM methylthiotransferase [Anaerolineales bacterium]|nr:MiaB/RimO family radical SAM methylthiotransferase [Anaerolineales bacterium]